MTEDTKSSRPVTDAIRVILEEGRQVRDRIKKIVASSVQDEEFSIATLGKIAGNVMRAAYTAVADQVGKSVPRDRDSALRDVIYGIGDAFGIAAKTAGAAFATATAQGREFASEDVKRVTVELRNLATALVDSVKTSGQAAVGHAAEFAKTAADHAAKAADEMKPAVEGALSAAAQHPVAVAQDAAKAGVDVARQVAGTLFAVLGEMMNKAAEALKVDDEEKPADESGL